jgi:hypothetical protein
MRNHRTKLAWIIVAGAVAAPFAVMAQANAGPGSGSCVGCGRMGRGGSGMMGGPRAFDPKAVTTIQAKVVDVQRIALGRHEGVQLTVAMGSENVAVRLGPDFYVDTQSLKLAKGDEIEVKGARTTFDGRPVIIAQEVRRGDQVLALRDANGAPLWRGQGMGPR